MDRGRLGDPDVYLRSIRTDVTQVSCPSGVVAAPGQSLQFSSTLFNQNELFTAHVSSTNTIARNWPHVAVSSFNIPPASNGTNAFTVPVPDTAAAGYVQISRQFSTGTACTWNVQVDPSLLGVGSSLAVLDLARVTPNPSYGGARLTFSLPGEKRVSVEILDLSGRRVPSIAQGVFTPGPHEYPWDGRDGTGERVHAGVFWAMLRAEGREITRRFVLLR